ncbi:hypothetical protein PG997_012852 [Apiospora hydei]|uniref:Rhodopsin domain-containing protein n=1 Tax=Apiospora hydei TaxID=1337664 RepID=A0ABR1V4I6_9PEZI
MAPSFNAERDGDVALVGNFVVWAMAVVSGIFLGFRVYIRQARNQLSWDDHALVGGWVFTIAQSAVFAEMLRRGFAKATIAEPTILLLMLIGDNLQKFALSLTKLSFSLTLLHIFPSGWQRWTIVALLLVINSYYIAHLFLVWLNICDLLSASSDFILAFLPLTRMLEVTLKSHDKWVAAVITTSVGVIAGLAGVVKGFEGIRLLDYESSRCAPKTRLPFHLGLPHRRYRRAQRHHRSVFHPDPANLLPDPAGLPRDSPPPGMGPYVASDNAGKFPGGGGGGSKIQDKHQSSDTFSESESKKNAQKQREQERQQQEEAAAEADAPGIMRTRTVAVTYDDNMIVGSPPPGTADIEMLSRSAPT